MNLTGAAAIVSTIGIIAGGTLTADTRYVKSADFDLYIGREMREELRDIELEIRRETNPELKRFLMQEYNELLEEYCAMYPNDDRRC